MIALIVGNNNIELDPDVRVPLNFQASNAEEIGNMLVSFTNSFDIPLTDNNRAAFENAGEIPSLGLLPYKIVESRLLINGRDLFGLSRIVILEYTIDSGWKVAFFAGNTTYTLNGSLRDLDLSQYNFVLTPGVVQGQCNNSTGVVYGAINYGVDNLVKQCDIRYSHFSFYIATLIQRIFLKQNIPVTIKNPSGTFYNRMVIPATEPKKIQSEISGFKAVKNATQAVPGNTVALVSFQSVVSGNLDGGYNAGTSTYTVNKPGKYKITSRVTSIVASDAGLDRAIQIVISGAGSYVGTSPITNIQGVILGTNVFEVSTEITVMTTPITVIINYITQVFISIPDQLQLDSYFQVEGDPELLPGNTVDVAASMPDMTQGDLFKQVMTMSNAIAYFQFGSLTIMGFDRLQSSETVDVSSKLDTSQPIITLLQSELGRTTEFRYANDSFAPSETIGCAKVEFDNDVLEPVKEWTELIFSACEDATFMRLFQTIKIPLWNVQRSSGGGTCSRSGGAGSISVVFSAAHKLAIGQYFFVQASNTIYYVTGITSATVVTVFWEAGQTLPNFSTSPWEIINYSRQNLKPRIGFALEASDPTPFSFRSPAGSVQTLLSKRIVFNSQAPGIEGLGWTYLLKNYFPLWLGSMERFKLVRAYFNITDDDAYNIDFTKKWYVARFGAQFYVQRVNKYVGDGNSTEVEIFRLGDFIDPSKIKPL